jgi:hypothetical protein
VEQPAVAAVSANIRIDRNARERMEVWESLVVQIADGIIGVGGCGLGRRPAAREAVVRVVPVQEG